jgi:hypothetical protein
MDEQPTLQSLAEGAKRNRIVTAVSGTVHKLSAQQRTAVIEYLCGASKTKACEIAEYKHPTSQASRVFSTPSVQAVIDEFFHNQEMTAGALVARLSEQAAALYSEYFRWDEEKGELYTDVRQMIADGRSYLIKDVSWKMVGESKIQVVEFQPTFDSQMAVMRYLGLFTDRTEVSGPGGQAIRMIEVVAPPPQSPPEGGRQA